MFEDSEDKTFDAVSGHVYAKCRAEVRAHIGHLEKEQTRLEHLVSERYNRLEAKFDTMCATITAWMISSENRVGKIDGKVAMMAGLAGAVGGSLVSFFVKG